MTIVEMVEQFQCPGCVCGSDSKCGSYKFDPDYVRCTGHVLGTMVLNGRAMIGNVALGLPKGFCRPGWTETGPDAKGRTRNYIDVRLWPKDGETPKWDHFNIAAWAMEKDGFLFVRTFAPRVNHSWVDVIEGGTLALTPNAVNVGAFIDEID